MFCTIIWMQSSNDFSLLKLLIPCFALSLFDWDSRTLTFLTTFLQLLGIAETSDHFLVEPFFKVSQVAVPRHFQLFCYRHLGIVHIHTAELISSVSFFERFLRRHAYNLCMSPTILNLLWETKDVFLAQRIPGLLFFSPSRWYCTVFSFHCRRWDLHSASFVSKKKSNLFFSSL